MTGKRIYFIISGALILGAFIFTVGFSVMLSRKAHYLENVNDEIIQTVSYHNKIIKGILSSKEEEISKIKSENNLLSGRIDKLKGNNKSLKEKLSSLKFNIKKYEALKAENQKLNQSLRKISGLWKKKFSDANEKTAVLNRSYRALKYNLLIKDRELGKLKFENERLSRSLGSVKTSRGRYVLRERAFKKEIYKLKRDNSKVKSNLNLAYRKIGELSRGKDILERKLAGFKADKKALEKEIKNLKGKIASLNENINKSQAALKEKAEEIIRLVDKNNALKKKADSISGLIQNINQLKTSILKKDKQLSEMNKELSGLKSANAQLKKEVADGAKKINDMKITLGARAEKVLALKDEITRYSKELSKTNARVKDYIKELSLVREQYVGSKLENARLSKELADDKSRLLIFQNQISGMAEINYKLKDKIQSISSLFNKNPAVSANKTNKKVEVKLKSVSPGKK